MSKKCGMKTEIFSRVCGYHRPVRNWNKGKQEEFKDRKSFEPEKKAGVSLRESHIEVKMA